MRTPGGPRVVLVTGTDTGVGKTVVAAGLARRLREDGVRVVALKPVESGCDVPVPAGEDGVLLAEAAGQTAPRAALTRLAAPLAPPAAADRMGVTLDPRHWVREIRRLSADAEIALVEGAGGLLSPLAWDFTALDLARELSASALVVAADRLGTINHARLTLAALRAARVGVLGLVLSAPACPDDSTGGNAAALARVEPGLRLAAVPRLASASPSSSSSSHLKEVAAWVRSSDPRGRVAPRTGR